MASAKVDPDYKQEFEAQAGKGPEYEFPKTDRDARIPVVDGPNVQEEEDAAAPPVPGEDAPDITDADIAKEEELEQKEHGGEEWSEDLAQNTSQPGETPDVDDEE